MHKRLTAKELREKSDNGILFDLVVERRKELKLASPLDLRLQKLQLNLSKKNMKVKDKPKRRSRQELDWGWLNHSYPN
jgi:Trm5-related predicted tRNA methylase